MNDDRDIWGRTPDEQAASASMNSMFRAARDAKASRSIAGLTGETSRSSVQPPAVAERLARAVTDAEAAHRSGYGVEGAEQALTEALDAARLDREVREGVRDAKTGQFTPAAQAAVSFDGGVRVPVGGRKPRHKHGDSYEESPNSMFRKAIDASHAKSREENKGLTRGTGDLGGVVIANR
jgi:hypothetical protein